MSTAELKQTVATSGTWLLYQFTVSGSYVRNVEEPATSICDSFQVWIDPANAWDVRTFALDHDVRVLRLEHNGKIPDPAEHFHGVALDTYGDIIAHTLRLEIPAGSTAESLMNCMTQNDWFPHVEVTPLGIPLWLPEHTNYYSRDEDPHGLYTKPS